MMEHNGMRDRAREFRGRRSARMSEDRRRILAGLAGIAIIVAAAALNIGVAGPARAELSDIYILPRAAVNNDYDAVAQMLARGTHVDTEGEDNRAALSFAAGNGNLAIANILLSHLATVDHRDRFGNTALHWAAAGGHTEMVRRLLTAGATIDQQNRQGITPLMLAINAGRRDVVRVLIEAGADPQVQDFTGHDAFAWARDKPAIAAALKQAKAR